MNRRHLLKSTAGLGAAIFAATHETEATQQRPPAIARGRGPYLETRDGQQLFYKEWGTGSPIVFLAAWALPSDMWDYQMVPLSEQGFRCIAYDRRGHGRSSDRRSP
jgi:alpha-beta hydrolase superfamily lysophospholipase